MAKDFNVGDVAQSLTKIVKVIMPEFVKQTREVAKNLGASAGDLTRAAGRSGKNFLTDYLARPMQGTMAGAAQMRASLAKPGVGLMEFVAAAEGNASGISTFMPDTGATLQRAATYYNASLTHGPRQSRLGVQQATFGILNQMGAITSLGADADVANILGSQGMSINRGVYGQTVTSVGNAARYLNMGNARAATAISGLTSGAGSSNMLRNFGIYTSDLKTGKEKTQGQIFEELANRLTAGRPKATVDETMDSIRRGNLGETIANSGLTDDQQTMFKQYMIDRAAGKKMDLSDQDAMKSLMNEAKSSGNENPLTGMMNLETAATGALQKAEGQYIGGINNATAALVQLQKASGGLAALLGGANAFMKTLLSDNTVQGMSQAAMSSLDLISSGMKAVLSTTVMGNNPQMAVSGTAAIVGGSAMAATTALTLGAGAVGGGGPGDGDSAMSNLTSAVTGAQTTSTTSTTDNGTVGSPMEAANILTKYGAKAYDNAGQVITDKHDGIDYQGTEGDIVRAVADGTVSKVKKDAGTFTAKEIKAKRYGTNSYGNYVTLEHSPKRGNGKPKTQHTVYSHLKDVFVKVGQPVKKGDPIGTMGRTGKAYSPHLHFEYKLDGKETNPANFKTYDDGTVKNVAAGGGMSATTLSQGQGFATALMGLFSGDVSQMTQGLSSLASALGIDSSKYGLASNGFGGVTGNTNVNTPAGTPSPPVTNNTTINVSIAQATPDEAKRFAELVAQYHDQNTLTSNMGRF